MIYYREVYVIQSNVFSIKEKEIVKPALCFPVIEIYLCIESSINIIEPVEYI